MKHLDLPEQNERNIKDNQDKIQINRDIIVILAFFIIVLIAIVMYLVVKQHKLADCQVNLVESITGKKQPKVLHDMFEEECRHD